MMYKISIKIIFILIISVLFTACNQKDTSNDIVGYQDGKVIKNAFTGIIPADKLKDYPTLYKVGNKIAKDSSLYLWIYEIAIRILDKFISLFGIILPLLVIVWLSPIFYFMSKHFSSGSIKEKFRTILMGIVLFLIVSFLIYVSLFYMEQFSISFFTLIKEILLLFLLFVFIVILAFIGFLGLLFFLIIGGTNGIFLFPDATLQSTIIELVNYKLHSLGITIEINKELFFVVLKLIVFTLLIKNISLIGNVLFFKFPRWFGILAVLLIIGVFIVLIYFYNQDVLSQIYLLFYQLFETLLRNR